MKYLCAIALLVVGLGFFSSYQTAYAGTVVNTTLRAKVISVVDNPIANDDILGVELVDQTVSAKIINKEEKGKEITVHNDYMPLKTGDVFYLIHTQNFEEPYQNTYTVHDYNRMGALYVLLALFLLAVVIFGGMQGIRGLVSLAGSIVLILYVLMPAILHGYSPVLVSIVVASVIIVVGSYITHGFNKTTSAAVLGMLGTVVFAGLLAYGAMHFGHLTGLGDEEAIYLSAAIPNKIDFAGLLFGGIMIGLLGVLYDIAISQAISVEELHKIAPHIPRTSIYKRAIRMGREHIGALVDTLAIAYVGASLPLLLLLQFYSSSHTGAMGNSVPIINQEMFATEIVRILVGSIGLILAVPITTFIASWMLIKKSEVGSSEQIESETRLIEHAGHHH